jgi:L-malate glycosyltransferase
MPDPIRIAFVLHVMQVAGAEMLVAAIIRRLGTRLAPVVICLDGIGQLGEQMLAEGVPVVALARRPGLDVHVSRRLAAELRRRRIEVVHAHQYTPFFYSALAKAQLLGRVHLIFTEHGRHYPDLVSRRRRLVNRVALARFADDITGVCRFSVRSLADVDGFGGRSLAVIENGIDVPPMSAVSRQTLRAQLGLDADRRYIACVARFHPVKDHRTLLRAFARVAAVRRDTDLLLVGDGPLRSELEKEVRAVDLHDRVRFLGVRHDVSTLLQAVDVFALTSISEAASITLLEAMAAAVPVVVTDVGGNNEIVQAGLTGELVPRGDADAAAYALLSLLGDASTAAAMGSAGRRRVEHAYRLDDTVRRYAERYAAGADRLRGARRSAVPVMSELSS